MFSCNTFVSKIGITCCAKTTEFVGNGGNVVFLYILVLWLYTTISQTSPGSKKSNNFGISWPGIPLIILANPSTSSIILAESR
jgi:hypothetical protein